MVKKNDFVNTKRIKEASLNSFEDFLHSIPIFLGGIMIFVLLNNIIEIPYEKVFKSNYIWDSLSGAAIGSILSGEPLTSYILGKEFLNAGVSLLAVTAFLASWISVGIINIPFESIYLGKRFAFLRNFLSFIFSIVIAIILILIYGSKLK